MIIQLLQVRPEGVAAVSHADLSVRFLFVKVES